jgi:hypothetical protein
MSFTMLVEYSVYCVLYLAYLPYGSSMCAVFNITASVYRSNLMHVYLLREVTVKTHGDERN